MNLHKLKTWTKYFQQIKNGNKLFEVRKNDRNYCVGDALLLAEYDPNDGVYMDNEIMVLVTSILEGGQFGIEKEYCVMGIKVLLEFSGRSR